EEAPFVQRADVARAQPAVSELFRGRVVVVRAGDPRPAHLDLALARAVPGQTPALLADDPHLDPVDDPAGPHPPVQVLGAAFLDTGRRVGQAAPRAHLGHAPSLDGPQPVTLTEPLD